MIVINPVPFERIVVLGEVFDYFEFEIINTIFLYSIMDNRDTRLFIVDVFLKSSFRVFALTYIYLSIEFVCYLVNIFFRNNSPIIIVKSLFSHGIAMPFGLGFPVSR